MADLRDGVALTELGVITRWSLAVRQPEAERADLIAELRADLAWLEGTPTQAAQPAAPQRANDLTQEIAPARSVAEAAPAREAAPAPLRRLPRETASAARTDAAAARTDAAAARSVPPAARSTSPAKAPAKTAAKTAAKAAPSRATGAAAPAAKTGATKVAPAKAPRGRRPAARE